jgi:hypothetical protein
MNQNGAPKNERTGGQQQPEEESSERRAEKRIDGILTEIEDTTYGVLRKHDKKSPSGNPD